MDLTAIPIVSIAISVVICWALFSIFCSLIHECVCQIKAERGRFMKYYLLLQMKDTCNNINWGDALYQQANVSMLTRASGKPTDDIDAGIFASAMINAIGSTHQVKARVQALKSIAAADVQKINPKQMIDQQKAQSFLKKIELYKNPILYDYKAAVLLLQPSKQVSMFQQFLDQAELPEKTDGTYFYEQQVLRLLNQNLQNWYTELSERLTLWYKKKTRRRLFALGLLLALILNVDSIQLFGIFNKSPEARTAIIDFYHKNEDYLNSLANHLDSAVKVSDTSKAAVKLRTTQIAAADSLIKIANNYHQKADTLIKQASLPIGIQYDVFNQMHGKNPIFYLLKIIGILISGFAASMGAPFWFDLLKKAYSTTAKK